MVGSVGAVCTARVRMSYTGKEDAPGRVIPWSARLMLERSEARPRPRSLGPPLPHTVRGGGGGAGCRLDSLSCLGFKHQMGKDHFFLMYVIYNKNVWCKSRILRLFCSVSNLSLEAIAKVKQSFIVHFLFFFILWNISLPLYILLRIA